MSVIESDDPTSEVETPGTAAIATDRRRMTYAYIINIYHHHHLLANANYRQNSTVTGQYGREQCISRCCKYEVSYRIVSR